MNECLSSFQSNSNDTSRNLCSTLACDGPMSECGKNATLPQHVKGLCLSILKRSTQCDKGSDTTIQYRIASIYENNMTASTAIQSLMKFLEIARQKLTKKSSKRSKCDYVAQPDQCQYLGFVEFKQLSNQELQICERSHADFTILVSICSRSSMQSNYWVCFKVRRKLRLDQGKRN